MRDGLVDQFISGYAPKPMLDAIVDILVAKTFWHNICLLQQIPRGVCVHLFHHRQQHAPGSFGVGLGVVV